MWSSCKLDNFNEHRLNERHDKTTEIALAKLTRALCFSGSHELRRELLGNGIVDSIIGLAVKHSENSEVSFYCSLALLGLCADADAKHEIVSKVNLLANCVRVERNTSRT